MLKTVSISIVGFQVFHQVVQASFHLYLYLYLNLDLFVSVLVFVFEPSIDLITMVGFRVSNSLLQVVQASFPLEVNGVANIKKTRQI